MHGNLAIKLYFLKKGGYINNGPGTGGFMSQNCMVSPNIVKAVQSANRFHEFHLICFAQSLAEKLSDGDEFPLTVVQRKRGMVPFAISFRQNPTYLTKAFCIKKKKTSSDSVLYGN